MFDKGLNSKKGDDVWRMPTDERNRSRFDYLDERELGIEVSKDFQTIHGRAHACAR